MKRSLKVLTLIVIFGTMVLTPALLNAQGPEDLPSTLDVVQNTYLPPRDVLELARRFDGVTDIPAPPLKPERAWQVGDRSTFWVDNLDTDDKFQIEAELRVAEENVFMWVEVGRSVNEAALALSAATFSDFIYPTLRATFGSEPNPGIDGDPHVYVLHAGNLGNSAAAYFSSESLFPQEAVETSDAHEILYVNLDNMAGAVGTDYYDGVLAHEFQHMIHWSNDANEDSWLDEGMAEFAGVITGFDTEGFAPQFLNRPETQLNTWPETESTIPHYGAAFMFATYFQERFGDEATQLLVRQTENGFHSVDDTLAAIGAMDLITGQPMSHVELFADWTIANLLDEPALANGQYGYTLLSDALQTAAVRNTADTFPDNRDQFVPQYSAHYIDIDHMGPGNLRFDFTGTDTVRLVPTDAFSGSRMWYSNRGDNSNSRLTRAFDLSGVSSATLEYMTWYHIESLWDYAYIEISTDGGSTWTFLETPNTTRDDPHFNAVGPGYTGNSGSAGPVWIQERVDLTPYVGGEVLVRFEMITDLAVNTPGMVIDDVAIPEIGYLEDFESGDGGWLAEGWLYIDNVLPQEWIVQMVRQNAGTTTVERLLMPGEGLSGSWEIPIEGSSDNVTLIISPVAPVTTERGAFSYALARVK